MSIELSHERTIAQSPDQSAPPCLPPMLAKLGAERDLDRADHIFEPKLDGIRAICRKSGGKLFFYNRHCVEITDKYPEFEFGDAIAGKDVLLDGEIVLYDASGRPSFTELMKRHQRASAGSRRSLGDALRFAVFDVMWHDGDDLCARPLSERKKVLDEIVERGPHLEKTIFTTDGHRLWDAITARKLEGVIAKRADGPYESGKRTGAWVKIKSFQSVDCVIVGYRSDRRPISSLGVALYEEDGTLRFIGKVGTGFTDAETKRLRKRLDLLRVESPPATGVPASYRDIQWVRPEHVCELRYLEIGSQGMMRNPSYLGLRDDKRPEECGVDQIGK